jgi:type VI secretion system protein ImpB
MELKYNRLARRYTMAGREGMQRKLSRVRRPRVHIVTDVETGKSIEMPELPFVVGVLGDFLGHPSQAQAPLRDRRFVEINPDTFDGVLKSMKPRLSLQVENRLKADDSNKALPTVLNFESLEDFEPHRVAEQVPYLKELVDMRSRLNDLKGSMDGRIAFEELLEQAVRDSKQREQLAAEIEKFKKRPPSAPADTPGGNE